MSRELYKRIAPHFQRIAYDAVHPTTRNSELVGGDVGAAIALQNYLEEQKNDIRILYCPHLYGNRIRQSGNLNFVTKGYSANSPLKPFAEKRNLLTWTEEFDNVTWVKTRVSVASNVTNNPLGVGSAEKLIDTTDNNNHTLSASFFNVSESGIYTFSIYVKKEELNRVILTIQRAVTSTNNRYRVLFDLDNKVLLDEELFNSPIGVSNSILEVNNNWCRCSISMYLFANERIDCSIMTFKGDLLTLNPTYIGNGSDGIYIWGAQLELGSSASEYQRVLNANSWDGNLMDLTQTTAANQPYLCGNIAPNEKLCIKNPNGGQDFLTHPTISYGANEAWSVTTVLNWNGLYDFGVIWGSFSTLTKLSFEGTGLRFTTNGFPMEPFYTASKHAGKAMIVTFIYNNGAMSIYVDSLLVGGLQFQGQIDIGTLMIGFEPSSIRAIKGSIHFHKIQNNALTPQQVATEHSLLRALFPEIESVQIGNQTWATSNCEMAATPMGSVIQEMQANANVERVTNVADREFSSDTGWWNKSGNVSIANGVCSYSNAATDNSIFKNIGTVGRYYKVTYTVSNYTQGGISLRFAGSSGFTRNSNGTFTDYILCSNGTFAGYAVGTTTLDLDNISVQEIGWSGSQELYDGIYAQTAGTVEQKTLAACKAAAMWCHYNNSIDNGAIYGKLYNWFAVKLLQMDIDAYNAANPTTPWGWRVPTQADFETLSTTLGGNSVAGGKMKKEGFAYWDSPNTGATNESGFSAIGSGFRTGMGIFAVFNNTTYFSGINNYLLAINNNTNTLSIPNGGKIDGYSLRLIKTT